jgi:hypothetical protein
MPTIVQASPNATWNATIKRKVGDVDGMGMPPTIVTPSSTAVAHSQIFRIITAIAAAGRRKRGLESLFLFSGAYSK